MIRTEGITCYERDEILCEDQMCLRTGCRIRNERLGSGTMRLCTQCGQWFTDPCIARPMSAGCYQKNGGPLVKDERL